PLPAAPASMLHPDSIHVLEDGRTTLQLCNECVSAVKLDTVPALSIANHNFVGDVPDVLTDLTIVEEAMIARCRSKTTVIQLTEYDNANSMCTAQKGIRGNIIIFPQDPSDVARVLPPSLESVASPICVIFIGSSKPTKEWLLTRARPLIVRPERIRAALSWLKNNNVLYHDIEIDFNLLNSMPAESPLP
ncbi:hypothetical protein BJ165DRAFT_1306808, partial [Panaeolus papilionaceus]